MTDPKPKPKARTKKQLAAQIAKNEKARAKRAAAGLAPTPFHLGNELWKRRGRSGLRPTYERSDDLAEQVFDYFATNVDDPILEDRIVIVEGIPVHEPLRKHRLLSIGRLALHCCVSRRTWDIWKKERPDLLPIIEFAEEHIRESQVEGAAGNVFNANIIARLLGLSEHTKTDSNVRVEGVSVEFIGSKDE